MKLNEFEKAFHQEYHSLGENARKRRNAVLHGEHKILRNIGFVIAAFIALAVLSSFLLFVIFSEINQYDPTDSKTIRSGYFVENLKGDTMDVSFSWRVPNDRAINVAVINAEEYPEKIDQLKQAIISENFTEIPDERPGKDAVFVYYDGWKGAIQSINADDVKITVPQNFEFIESDIYEGDISITLSSLANRDGLTGITKILVDDSSEQILKARITIYDVDELTDTEFITIIRHEFGHALGLAHSSATEDLMYPTIQEDNALISQCDIDAMISLYNGEKITQVTCDT